MWSWLLNLFGLGKPTPARMARRLQDPRPDVRLEAVRTLATVPAPWALDLLVPLLDHPDAALRAAAREALLARGPAIVPAVAARIDRVTPEAARRLLDLLVDLGHADAVPVLLQALKYSARPVQLAAKQALIRLGAVATPALATAAEQEENPWVRGQMEEALAAGRTGQG